MMINGTVTVMVVGLVVVPSAAELIVVSIRAITDILVMGVIAAGAVDVEAVAQGALLQDVVVAAAIKLISYLMPQKSQPRAVHSLRQNAELF